MYIVKERENMLLVRNKRDERKAYRLDVKGKKGKDAKRKTKKMEGNETWSLGTTKVKGGVKERQDLIGLF